jgi:hypothetical protein
MAPQKLENNFLVSTLGKLLVFLVNYAYYATLIYYEFRKALTSPRERIEFVSQGPTVPDMFFISDPNGSARLSYIRLVAGCALDFINTTEFIRNII